MTEMSGFNSVLIFRLTLDGRNVNKSVKRRQKLREFRPTSAKTNHDLTEYAEEVFSKKLKTTSFQFFVDCFLIVCGKH